MTRLARSLPGFSSLGSLGAGQLAENVLVNRWNLEAGSINDKCIEPGAITTSKIQVGGITATLIEDGAITTDKLDALSVTGQKVRAHTLTGDHIEAGSITADEIDVSSIDVGDLTCTNLADISTLFAGSITITADGAGGEPNTGVHITSTRLRMLAGGIAMVDLNAGAGTYYFKGEVYATKVTVPASADNSVDLSLGTHVLATSITVGAQTLGDIQNNATTGAGRNRTFYQASAPTASNTGDLWLDSDATPPTLYRWNGSAWTTQEIGTVSHTYAQASQPASGMVAGDLWVDTDDGNKLYRYSGSTWTAYRDAGAAAGATAVQPKTGVVDVDGNKNITRITTSGVTISSSSTDSGQRLTMASWGLKGYDSGGTQRVQILNDGSGWFGSSTAFAWTTAGVLSITGVKVRDSSSEYVVLDSTGIQINNTSATPGTLERLRLAFDGVEKGYVACYRFSPSPATYGTIISGDDLVKIMAGTSNIQLTVTSGKEVRVTSGGNLTIYNGLCRANRYILTDGAGTDRASIYSGSGAPDSGVGAVGDIYIRTTGLFYQKTGASTWTQIS